jgi:hypothetical protein
MINKTLDSGTTLYDPHPIPLKLLQISYFHFPLKPKHLPSPLLNVLKLHAHVPTPPKMNHPNRKREDRYDHPLRSAAVYSRQ